MNMASIMAATNNKVVLLKRDIVKLLACKKGRKRVGACEGCTLTINDLPILQRIPSSRAAACPFDGYRVFFLVPTQSHFRELRIGTAVVLIEDRRRRTLSIYLDRELPA